MRRIRFAVFAPKNQYVRLLNSDFDDYFDDAWLGPLELLANHQMDIFDIAIPSLYYVRLKRGHEGVQYRLIEIVDGSIAVT